MPLVHTRAVLIVVVAISTGCTARAGESQQSAAAPVVFDPLARLQTDHCDYRISSVHECAAQISSDGLSVSSADHCIVLDFFYTGPDPKRREFWATGGVELDDGTGSIDPNERGHFRVKRCERHLDKLHPPKTEGERREQDQIVAYVNAGLEHCDWFTETGKCTPDPPTCRESGLECALHTPHCSVITYGLTLLQSLKRQAHNGIHHFDKDRDIDVKAVRVFECTTYRDKQHPNGANE